MDAVAKSETQLNIAESFDPGWIPDPGDPPWAGLRLHELVEDTPFGIAELLERRGEIVAALAWQAPQAQMTPVFTHTDATFLQIPFAADASLGALGSPAVAKGLSEFIGDLGEIGAGLVFRVEG